jgi:ATP-binding cassette subfamily F protein uup
VKVIDAENMSFAYPDGRCARARFHHDDHPRRQDRHHRPQRRGQDHADQAAARPARAHRGTIKHGTNLEVVYFDQLRAQIDDNKTVADNIANGNTTVTIDGRTRHVISYLQDFLFTPDRARTPARVLSGGERNRLLLARLFTKPANVLVLDEPTNDLDAETLDLLEDLLVEFRHAAAREPRPRISRRTSSPARSSSRATA